MAENLFQNVREFISDQEPQARPLENFDENAFGASEIPGNDVYIDPRDWEEVNSGAYEEIEDDREDANH